MVAFVLQEGLYKTDVVVMHNDACLLGVALDGSGSELGVDDAVGREGAEAGDGVDRVQVSAARNSCC